MTAGDHFNSHRLESAADCTCFSNTVYWLRSSAFDLLFSREMLEHADAGTPLQQISAVAEELPQRVPDLIAELGFEIYRRQHGGRQDIEPFLPR